MNSIAMNENMEPTGKCFIGGSRELQYRVWPCIGGQARPQKFSKLVNQGTTKPTKIYFKTVLKYTQQSCLFWTTEEASSGRPV